MIGAGRHFDLGKGIACGEQITGLPSGNGPQHDGGLVQGRGSRMPSVVGWGNEQGQGKVIDECFQSAAHLDGMLLFRARTWRARAACRCRSGCMSCMSYKQGDSRVYVNGRLDGSPETAVRR